jgi:oxygen-independent coproporphyrinogen-3 oxidase
MSGARELPGIYIHIPFCDTKCIYCDFYSITNHIKKQEFINALLKEISYYSPLLKQYRFDTIFFGGGTPSLLDRKDFELIFESLYRNYSISDNSEITIEANPGTLNRVKLLDFKKLPVNRISFGVQSFSDADLKFLTRIHTAGEAKSSIKFAQEAGYNNINLDLIFALPNQSLDDWKFNLATAVSLKTQHISAYSLIYEEGTPLYNMYKSGNKAPLSFGEEMPAGLSVPQAGRSDGAGRGWGQEAEIELEREMFDYTSDYLSGCGFEHYEISNFAKPGYECRHNLKYWQREEYIAFGPSASSFIGDKRWTNIRNLIKYIELIQTSEVLETSEVCCMPAWVDYEEKITAETAITEHIFLGLRSRGIELNKFRNTFNYDFIKKHSNSINTLVNGGYAKVENNVFSLTVKGYALCDEIAAVYF